MSHYFLIKLNKWAVLFVSSITLIFSAYAQDETSLVSAIESADSPLKVVIPPVIPRDFDLPVVVVEPELEDIIRVPNSDQVIKLPLRAPGVVRYG